MKTYFTDVILYRKTALGLQMECHRCVMDDVGKGNNIGKAVKTGLMFLENHGLEDHKGKSMHGSYKASELLIMEAGDQIGDDGISGFHVVIDMEFYTLCLDERQVDIIPEE